MLFERWRQIAGARSSELALHDVATGERWTFNDLLRESEKSLPADPIVFPRGPSASFILHTLRAWRGGKVVCPLEADQPVPRITSLPASGIVHLKATSGTGSEPRMVAMTADQLAADAANIVETMGLRPEWPNIAAISLAHSYGFSNLVLPLLLHGIPLVLAWSALPEALRAAASTGGEFALPAVPALWRAWFEAGAIPQSIRLAISAGAPLQVSIEREVFAALGLKIHNFYGSSECGGIAYDGSTTPRTVDTVAGRPMANVAVQVNAQGCLEVRSKAVAWGYWPKADETLGGGRFLTSDLGEIVAGEVRILGRAGDIINVAGRKLSPETVEAALLAHPDVRGCVVFGIESEDASRGDTVVACISGLGELRPDALRDYALRHLPAWQVPREWWITESLQANARGKIPRAEWRRKFMAMRQSA